MIALKYESRMVIHFPDRVVESDWQKTETEKAIVLAKQTGISENGIEFQVRTLRHTLEIIPGFAA